MVRELAAGTRTRMVDFSKLPGVVDIFDDSMIGTPARKAADEAIAIMAQNICDEIDAGIIEELTSDTGKRNS